MIQKFIYFLYENKILEYVVNGNVQELSNMIFKLSNGVVCG